MAQEVWKVNRVKSLPYIINVVYVKNTVFFMRSIKYPMRSIKYPIDKRIKSYISDFIYGYSSGDGRVL